MSAKNFKETLTILGIVKNVKESNKFYVCVHVCVCVRERERELTYAVKTTATTITDIPK